MLGVRAFEGDLGEAVFSYLVSGPGLAHLPAGRRGLRHGHAQGARNDYDANLTKSCIQLGYQLSQATPY